MTKFRMRAAALAGLAGLALGAAAHAAVIFSDFGAGDSYTQDFGWTVQGGYSASAFQSSGDYDVTQIDLALGHVSGTNAAVVSLWTNELGTLGTQLGSWGVSGQPTFGDFGAGALTSITNISGVHLVAGGGYFLQVASTGDVLDAWNANSIGYLSDFVQNGVPFGPTTAGAFDVIGTSGVVPEPACWMMMMVGFGGLGSVLRRRRRAELAPYRDPRTKDS